MVLEHLTLMTLTFEPEINRVHLLPRMDVQTKFEEGRSRRSRVIDRKRFWHIWSQWPWPLTPLSIGFICYPGWMCEPGMRKVGQGVLKLLVIDCGRFDLGDLDLWPSDAKLNRDHLLPMMDVWMKVGQGVLELLIGQTDMCKAICPLKGVIIQEYA